MTSSNKLLSQKYVRNIGKVSTKDTFVPRTNVIIKEFDSIIAMKRKAKTLYSGDFVKQYTHVRLVRDSI